MANRKDFLDVIKKAEKQGWTVNRVKSGHFKWVNPEGQSVFSSYSPSDFRAIRKHISTLKKYGYQEK